MSFTDDINRHRKNRDKRMRDLFVGVTDEVKRSVVEGSEITGAPGQPVDKHRLKPSWIGRFRSKTRWMLTTKVIYAPIVEVLPESSIRSEVGGPRSVAKTRTGFRAIVEFVNAKLGAP